MEERAAYVDTGPIAALPLDCADPDRDAAFWSWLTGWTTRPASRPGPCGTRRCAVPSSSCAPSRPPRATGKNRLHLDVRLETGDDPDEVAAGIAERGGRELHPEWGDLPWRHYADPSGNEFCVLPARSD